MLSTSLGKRREETNETKAKRNVKILKKNEEKTSVANKQEKQIEIN